MTDPVAPERDRRFVRDSEHNARQFFATLAAQASADLPREASVLCVAHMLPGTFEFIEALSSAAHVARVLVKPNSIHPDELELVGSKYAVQVLDRHYFSDASNVIRTVDDAVPSGEFVVLDIGGYFAPSLGPLYEEFRQRFLGVVEDTENGAVRYEALPSLPVPVLSVARSEIKEIEDYLVGQWIVFSTEALMREFGSILNGRLATVVGYGRIGQSVAAWLAMRSVSITVVETDPVRAIMAKARGFQVRSIDDALGRGNIVVSATGSMAMRRRELGLVRSGSYIATVTSADDEIDTAALRAEYECERVSPHVERFSKGDQYFYLLNEGNAVNFVHRGGLGPFIRPVQGEILTAMIALLNGAYEPGISSLDGQLLRDVADVWLDVFSTVNSDV